MSTIFAAINAERNQTTANPTADKCQPQASKPSQGAGLVRSRCDDGGVAVRTGHLNRRLPVHWHGSDYRRLLNYGGRVARLGDRVSRLLRVRRIPGLLRVGWWWADRLLWWRVSLLWCGRVCLLRWWFISHVWRNLRKPPSSQIRSRENCANEADLDVITHVTPRHRCRGNEHQDSQSTRQINEWGNVNKQKANKNKVLESAA